MKLNSLRQSWRVILLVLTLVGLLSITACSPQKVQSGPALSTHRYGNTTVTAAALSSDGHLSLLAAQQQVCLWENDNHQKVMPCIDGEYGKNIEILGISSSQQYFFTSNRIVVRLYKIMAQGEKAQLVNEWFSDNNIINDIAISAKGDTLLLGYRNGQASVISTLNGARKTFRQHRLDINTVAISDDGQLAFTGSSDKTAVLWRTQSGEKIQSFKHRTRVNHLDLSTDGSLGFSLDSIDDRRFWHLNAKTEISELQTSLRFIEVNHSAFSSDQQYFLTGSPKQKLQLWRVSDGELIGEWLSTKIGRSSVLQVAFVQPTTIAILTSDGNYELFSVALNLESATTRAANTDSVLVATSGINVNVSLNLSVVL
jgi:WD40 repeat protein